MKEFVKLDLSQDNYLEYVQAAIQDINEYSDLVRDGQIIPARLHIVMAKYVRIAGALQMEFQRVKTQHKRYSEKFQMWQDEKIVFTRDELRSSRPASSSISMKEIETQVRVDNRKEYQKWREELLNLEEKLEFLKSLAKIWDKEDNLLVTLSHNMRSEMKSLSIIDRANAQPKSKMFEEEKKEGRRGRTIISD